jgi:hypothetical protein
LSLQVDPARITLSGESVFPLTVLGEYDGQYAYVLPATAETPGVAANESIEQQVEPSI